MKSLTNRDFNNTNLNEMVLHFGMSFKNNTGSFFKTVAFDRALGVLLIGYADSTDFFVFSNNYVDVTGPHFPVKTNAAKQKLAQLIARDPERWYSDAAGAGVLDISRDIETVGVYGSNALILRYLRSTYIMATWNNNNSVTFDKETLVTVNPVVLNVFSKYLTIPGLVQTIVSENTPRSKMSLSNGSFEIKGLFEENNNRTVLSLTYKNQPLTFNTNTQHLTVPRNNTLGLTNTDRVVLEKYVKEFYVYNTNTRRLVNGSVKSFKPVKSVPELTEDELAVLSGFTRRYNGKRLLVDARQNSAVFNGGNLYNNGVQELKRAVTKIIDSALPSGSDRRGYWNGNYNVIFRNNVDKDYALYQDWHRDIDKQYNQSMYAFVIFFINGDDRYDGGELVCVRPRANTTVDRSDTVTCNPVAATGQAVVLHAATGYHKVTPYVRTANNNGKNNRVVARNMLLIQLFTNRYMLNERNQPVGSVKSYANNRTRQKLNESIQ